MCVPASYAPRERCICIDQTMMNSIGNLFIFLLIRHFAHMTSQKSLDNLWHNGVTKNPGTPHAPYQEFLWSWCFLTAAVVLGSISVYFHYQSQKEFYLIPLISRFVCSDASSGSDRIPVELFQILKDDAVKVLHSICQQFRKLSSGHRTGKGQFSFQSQRKAMPKSVQTTAQLHSSHTLAK